MDFQEHITQVAREAEIEHIKTAIGEWMITRLGLIFQGITITVEHNSKVGIYEIRADYFHGSTIYTARRVISEEDIDVHAVSVKSWSTFLDTHTNVVKRYMRDKLVANGVTRIGTSVDYAQSFSGINDAMKQVTEAVRRMEQSSKNFRMGYTKPELSQEEINEAVKSIKQTIEDQGA